MTVADSITMTAIGGPWFEYLGRPPAQFSPNRKSFLVITRKGSIRNNTNVYSLLMFRVRNVGMPYATVLLRVESGTNGAAIDKVRWMQDSRRILLLVKHGRRRELDLLDSVTRSVVRVDKHLTDIACFDATEDLRTVVFLARPKPQRFTNAATADTGMIVSEQHLTDLLTGHTSEKDDYGRLYAFELYVQTKGGLKQINLNGLRPDPDALSLSPDGKHAIVAVLLKAAPEKWKQYKEPILSRIASNSVMQYFVVDTISGTFRPLLNAPVLNWSLDVLWSRDSKSVIVAGTYLPLESVSTAETQLRETSPFVAQIQIASGRSVPVAAGNFRIVDSLPYVNSVILESSSGTDASPEVSYKNTGTRWMKGNELPSQTGASVVEEQGLNLPARLMWVENGKRKLLLELNPQLRSRKWGRVEEIEWMGTDGHPATGGLYLPPDYKPGVRYPLVIQTHGWNPDKFWIDGPSNAGFAAQALAGHGFIVAQTANPGADAIGTTREGPQAMGMFEGLIDYLDQRGMIDPKRVGLVGWSRTGYHVLYTLAFSRYRFAAAVISDGLEAGYFQYFSWLNLGQPYVDMFEQVNGGPPFGSNLERWMKNVPSFHLDQVRTPMRLLAFLPDSVLDEWELFAGLKHLGKPVEFIWFPDAEHSPEKPSERMVAQGGSVDWFCFWLKGEEDSVNEKASQYARWRELRRRQEAALKPSK
jgi:dipeptidyl aminopeptidase/acylaminoacyl peptidase